MLVHRFGYRRLLVDALALIFGIGAWLGVNSIYVQLPLLVNNAPEGWNLPAFMSLISAIGNIGPLLYSLYAKCSNRNHDDLLIYGLLGGSTVAIFCLIFLHEKTSYIFGADRSTAVLGFMFVAAYVGCTSSVLFMPYMRNYREIYLVSYLVGEGLSGFLPSILALIQGVGGNPECVNGTDSTPENPVYVSYYPDPRFSTSVFFSVISAILFLSFTAFFGLNYLPISRDERVNPPGSIKTHPSKSNPPATSERDYSDWRMPRKTYVYLLVMMGVVCALGNTGLSSIQSYSCLPYGNVAYHLAVTLGSMASPLAMCIGFIVKNPRVDVLSFLTTGIVALAAFLSYLAVMSPAPPLQHTWTGEFIVVVAWVVINGLVGFVKLAITTLFRPDPGRGLFYTGVVTQIGSLTGAVVSFYFVNLTEIFVTYSPCDDLVVVGSANRRLLVDVLALAFGIGAWLGVNGIFIQLPLLVNEAPEGWKLPAYMTIVVQVANLGPLFYSLYAKYSNRTRDDLLIYGLLGGSTVAIFCLVFLHGKTSYIFGEYRSTAILGCMFVAALVGCTSSVLSMPYMRNWQEMYLVSYIVGEGLSGFLPSILALMQGVGGIPQCVNATDPNSKTPLVAYYPEPRFTTSVFFALVSIILFLSFISFTALNNLSVSRGERVKPLDCTEALPTELDAPPAYKTDSGWKMPRRTYVYLLVMMGVICSLGNTGLASIQSYSCLPYGNLAYHLAVTLGSMASPLAMCIGFIVKNPRVHVLSFLIAGIISLAAFVFYLALMSPAPPLQHTRIGEFIVVIAWVAVHGLIGFVKLAIATLFRPDPGRGLFYTGVATQIGSLTGAVVTFILVNHSKIFVPYLPCNDFVVAGST